MKQFKTAVLYTLAVAYAALTYAYNWVSENKEEIQLHLELFTEAVVKGTKTATGYVYNLGADTRLWWEVEGYDNTVMLYNNGRQLAVVYGLTVPA